MTQINQNQQVSLNGQSLPSSEITNLAFSGFAHFTALQVRDRKVKGIDLHLDRLHQASLQLFGRALPDKLIRSYLRKVIDNSPANLSITITIYSPKGEFTAESMDVEPSVLIRTAPPNDGPHGPLRLSAINHERPLPEIKHVGEIGKTYYLHQAIKQGFDDVAFMDNKGQLSEGSIWNLVFWDNETVIWPKARILTGTMMGIVQRQLARLNIPQRSEVISLERLATLKGAAVMNSWTPGIAVTEISSNQFNESNSLVTLLHKAISAEPAERV